MDLHELTNTPGAVRRVKRLGRGMSSGTGKTSGHGHKGQMARKGHKRKPGFEGGQMPLIRRIPKRGANHPFSTRFTPVNVEALNRFEDGAVLESRDLVAAGVANAVRDGIKVLGRGELTRKVTVKAAAFSAAAKTKIEAAGGRCEVV